MPDFESRAGDWLPFDEALERVLNSPSPLAPEAVTLEEALGRALTHDVVAPTQLPPWDSSAMDGYAVRGDEVVGATEDQPIVLVVTDVIHAALPPSSPLDVFFDMEGYPAADDWLDYLFGAVVIEEGKPIFYDWWGHSESQEKKAFEAFIDWVYDRWAQDPAMHIYHYAAYETHAAKRLMGKYGTREDKVDNLLRNDLALPT